MDVLRSAPVNGSNESFCIRSCGSAPPGVEQVLNGTYAGAVFAAAATAANRRLGTLMVLMPEMGADGAADEAFVSELEQAARCLALVLVEKEFVAQTDVMPGGEAGRRVEPQQTLPTAPVPEHLLQEAWESCPGILFVVEVGADGRFRALHHNRAAERFTGQPNAEISGRYLEEALPAPLATKAPEICRLCLSERVPVTVVDTLRMPSGEKCFSTTVYPRHDSQGKITHIFGFAKDITGLLAARKNLSEAEERIHAIFDSVSDAVMMFDMDTGNILEVNRRFEEMFGYSREEALNLSVTALSVDEPPYAQEEFRRWTDRTCSGEQSAVEWLAQGKSGRRCRLDLSMRRSVVCNLECLLVCGRDITGRREEQVRITELNEFYQKVIDEAPVSILVFDVHGRCVRANEAAAITLGKSLAELQDESVCPYPAWQVPGLNDLGVGYVGRECLSAREPRRRVVHIRTESGKDAWLDCHLVPLSLKEQPHVLLILNDITAQEQRLALLQESETRVRALLQQLPIGVALVDQAENITHINDHCVRMLGWTPDDVPTMESWWPLAYPDPEYRSQVREQWTGYVRRAQQEGADIPAHEYRVTCKDGTVRTIEIFGRTLSGLDMIILNDVTARKQAEQSLREGEERLRGLVEQTAVGIVSTGLDGRILRTNPAFCRITGYSDDELAGRYYSEFTAAEDLEGHARAVARILADPTSSYTRGKQYVRKDGTLISVEVTASVLRSPDGSPRELFAIVLDKSEKQRALEAVKEARDELEKANASLEARVAERTAQLAQSERHLKKTMEAAEAASRAKSEFLTNMSHEIRTPLHAITGMISLLERTSLDYKQHNYLRRARDASEALLSLINDILDLSKIESGKLDIESVEFDLGQVLKDVASTLVYRAQEKGIEFIVDLAPAVPLRLEGDSLRLRQVLTNLVGNAIKFTEKGEVVVCIREIERHDGNARLKFAVTDTGIGLSGDLMDSIMEPFAQADSSITRRYGGTGLGLAISTRLLARMGSGLEVVSELGKGSSFSFDLKLPVASSQSADISIHPANGPSVLVVEANGTSRQAIVSLLARLGGVCTSVGSGEEGVKAALAPGPDFDLVLMGWRLPGIDGIEAGRCIRAQNALDGRPPPPIVIVTAYERKIAQMSQDFPVVAKPLTPADLGELMRLAHGRGEEKKAQSADDFSGKKVLLVEDKPINQEVAAVMLQAHGVDVIVAGDGAQAVEIVCGRAVRPDLILMDLQMPVLDGYEATRLIREHLGADAPPIAAMTAHAFSDEAKRCFQAGMVAHLTKPVKPEDLAVLLARYLGGPTAGMTRSTIAGPGGLAAKWGGGEGRSACAPDDAQQAEQESCPSGGQGELWCLMPRFRECTALDIQQLRDAMNKHEAERLVSTAHGLKGSCATMHAHAMRATCADIESAARGQEWSRVESFLRRLEAELERFCSS